MTPDISIVMISFRQEDYIQEALESVLDQSCNASFEVIISDDDSPDKTADVIGSVINNHPKGKLVTFIRQNPNLGMMQNFAFVLQKATGKYIAICEGDDYWTDTNKLQKQYDILEQNPDFVLSFHNAKIKIEKTGDFMDFNNYQRTIYNSENLFDSWLIPTASAFFRNCLPKKLPEFLQSGTHGDLGLFLLLGEFGKFHYTDAFMSVYRINSAGITQSFKGVEHNNRHIQQLVEMEQYFGERHATRINERIANYHLSNAFHTAGSDCSESNLSLKKSLERVPLFRFSKMLFIMRIRIKNLIGG